MMRLLEAWVIEEMLDVSSSLSGIVRGRPMAFFFPFPKQAAHLHERCLEEKE
jgi:hypothetical protein